MFKFFSGMLDRIFAAAGGLLFSQAPAFMGQYMQRLGGHLEELRIQVGMMTNMAKVSGKTLEQYIQKFLTSSDIDFANQGIVMQKMVDRWEQLSKSFYAIEDASLYTRPFIFLGHLDYEIAASTFDRFNPTFVFSFETFAYVLVGIMTGYVLYQLLKAFLGKIFLSNPSLRF